MDQSIRDLFPVVRSKTYLNSAAMAPMPTLTIDAITAQLDDVAANGAAHVDEWSATKGRVRSLVASMLCVPSETIAFTRNTSDGLCSVASGIDWTAGDNIVSFEKEFPANYYPWRKVSEDKGVELRLCPERNGRIDLDEFCSLIDDRTRLVTLSAVQYHSGFRTDLERVGRIARQHGALFCVDIIQALGAIPFDLPAQLVDIAAGSSYKWLCSPEGCGIFYLNDRAREQINPPSRGWTSVANAWDFCDREQPLVPDSRAWETGMGGSALFYGVEQSLKLISNAGVEKITRHLENLTYMLCDLVPSSGFEVVSSRRAGERSQIVAIRPPVGQDCTEVVRKLADDDIAVSARDGCIRVSPHFFNNEDDVNQFARSLRLAIARPVCPDMRAQPVI